MVDQLFIYLSAVWLGILTSISPCPLATNIAAISVISGKDISRPSRTFLAGLLYAIGRTLTYVILAILILSSLVRVPILSHYLQKYMNMLIGPTLIIGGMFILRLLSISLPQGNFNKTSQHLVEKGGLAASLIIGVLFALTFCPISAAIFFGSLIPMSFNNSSSILLPSIYGLGTAIPVLGCCIAMSFGINSVGRFFDAITKIEVWARNTTGAALILIGIYLTMKFTILLAQFH